MDEKFELPKIGDILMEEFLEPLEITPYRLAKDIGVSTSSILDLVHNKRKISVEMSLRLSKYFGTTSKFWLNMQNELDLREIQEKLGNDLDKIPSCKQIASQEVQSRQTGQAGLRFNSLLCGRPHWGAFGGKIGIYNFSTSSCIINLDDYFNNPILQNK